MKGQLLVGIALAALAIPAVANAADLPVKAPPTQIVAPVTPWTGFYWGLDVGVRSTRTDATTTSQLDNGIPVDFTGMVTSEPLDGTAFRFGTYLGYNWHLAPQWVLGVEGDLGWANRTTTLNGIIHPGDTLNRRASDTFGIKTTWDASVRGRVGYLVTPASLIYLTGGAAWLHFESTSTCGIDDPACSNTPGNFAPFSVTHSSTKGGWTIGGGLAAALAASWTGFYVGLAAGQRSTRTDATTTSAFDTGDGVFNLAGRATSEPLDGTAFRFGPYVGYNWQAAPRWLLGVEGDFGWASQTTTLGGFGFSPGFFVLNNCSNDSFAMKTTWDATARARVGYLVTPSFLAYLTGGAAWLHYETTSICLGTNLCIGPPPALPAIIASSTTKAGWTIGGGIETMLWSNWFARGEYRYADFGTEPFTLTRTAAARFGPFVISSSHDITVRTHTALFGIAYKFGDAGAVIAKY